MNRQHFRDWYVTILNDLYPTRKAGFAILMIVFPLLERYLREKSKMYEARQLGEPFYLELRKIFPELFDGEDARIFWKTYHHGLLHQVTVSFSGILSNDLEAIKVDNAGVFCVHPAKFATKVITIIENDFETFEGKGSPHHPLPTEFDMGQSYEGTAAPSAKFNIWLGSP